MKDFMIWLDTNKEWLFNGAGGIALITIIGFVGRLIFKKTRTSLSQNIRSGDNSINLQAGRDVKFNNGSKTDDLENK